MSKFDWKKTLGTVAPMLASAIGSPMAGAAVSVLAKEFLHDENASEQKVAAAIVGANPEQLARLREIDARFALDMERLGVDVLKLEAADRESARGMAKLVGIAPQVVLSAVYNVGYFLILYQFINSAMNDSMGDWQKGVIGTLVGILTAAIPQINNFWFGSSSGSKEKTAKMVGST